MGLYYGFTRWLDHVVQFPGRKKMTDIGGGIVEFERSEGQIIQQGTSQSAKNFNNVEEGILANQIQVLQIEQRALQMNRSLADLKGAIGNVTLTNTQSYPFNNSTLTVPISAVRSTLDYKIEIETTEVTGGFVESFSVFDKQINGFKINFTGSAKTVKVRYKVVGGMYK